MARFFRMHREQKLASIERHQRQWPKPTIHWFDIQVGKARVYRIGMNRTPHLPTQTIMMQGPKNALVAPNGVHLGKIEFLSLLLSSHPVRTFSKGLVLMVWSLLTEVLFDHKLPFLAHVRQNALKVLRNVLTLGWGDKHNRSTATIAIGRHFVVKREAIVLQV